MSDLLEQLWAWARRDTVMSEFGPDEHIAGIAADEIERLSAELRNKTCGFTDCKALARERRLRAALESAHDVLANGGDLKTDTYQTRCNRALAITREALRDD